MNPFLGKIKRVKDPSINSALTQILDLVQSYVWVLKPGMVMMTMDEPASVKSPWYVLNGQAISRIDNPKLFALMGVTYGAGDGSTTFNIPDFQGRLFLSADPGLGSSVNGSRPGHLVTQQPGDLVKIATVDINEVCVTPIILGG